MTLVIQGSLMLENVLNGHPQDYQVRDIQRICNSRYGHIAIDEPHMTILSSRDLKVLKESKGMTNKAFKKWMKEMIVSLSFPSHEIVINTVSLRKSLRVLDDGSKKESCYLLPSNYFAIHTWREDVMKSLGVLNTPRGWAVLNKEDGVVDILPDGDRLLHISISNLTGNPHDSVSNPKDTPAKEESQ